MLATEHLWFLLINESLLEGHHHFAYQHFTLPFQHTALPYIKCFAPVNADIVQQEKHCYSSYIIVGHCLCSVILIVYLVSTSL